MLLVNENDKEYRFGDSGPKYLMRGPNVDFGIVRLKPGEGFPNHLHQVIEEDFFILEGEIEFRINGEKYAVLKKGDFIHVSPNNAHFLKNVGEVPAKAVFVKAPYDPNDKVDVD
ncbi:MAG TPA: cupin domain-containing protein [Thermotogota bacterium]|nr:cupin domain-containing protein [Thermotogota bacterium]HPJ90060.1 cupin domain-containing protein [Thermotogota bacterium]HPR97337.1 cupin domain-containing protein [Thermotogota bacterium]